MVDTRRVYSPEVLDALRSLGAHPRVEPHVAHALRARRVQPAWRFFLGEESGRGSGTYAVRGRDAHVHLEHGTTDAATFDQAFVQGAYAITDVAAAHLRSLGRPPRALDLGANIGMWSAWLLADWPGAVVTAVEPLPRNAALLRRNVALADPSGRSTVVEAAAGTAESRVVFGGGDFTNGRILEDGDGLAVRMIDAFPLMADVDLLNLDIEGGEWPILADPRFADVSAPVVMLEVHPMGAPAEDTLGHARQRLEALGYRTEVPLPPDYPGTGTIWAVRD